MGDSPTSSQDSCITLRACYLYPSSKRNTHVLKDGCANTVWVNSLHFFLPCHLDSIFLCFPFPDKNTFHSHNIFLLLPNLTFPHSSSIVPFPRGQHSDDWTLHCSAIVWINSLHLSRGFSLLKVQGAVDSHNGCPFWFQNRFVNSVPVIGMAAKLLQWSTCEDPLNFAKSKILHCAIFIFGRKFKGKKTFYGKSLDNFWTGSNRFTSNKKVCMWLPTILKFFEGFYYLLSIWHFSSLQISCLSLTLKE